MNPIAKRKLRQRIQQATDKQFWEILDEVNSQAYYLGQQHIREAMECTAGISKKQVEVVMSKAKQIREQWDGIYEAEVTKG